LVQRPAHGASGRSQVASQVPASQRSTGPHDWLQSPQCEGSVDGLTQAPWQWASPGPQALTQRPLLQASLAAHWWPQAPQ
jgi:hypothetical protein